MFILGPHTTFYALCTLKHCGPHAFQVRESERGYFLAIPTSTTLTTNGRGRVIPSRESRIFALTLDNDLRES